MLVQPNNHDRATRGERYAPSAAADQIEESSQHLRSRWLGRVEVLAQVGLDVGGVVLVGSDVD